MALHPSPSVRDDSQWLVLRSCSPEALTFKARQQRRAANDRASPPRRQRIHRNNELASQGPRDPLRTGADNSAVLRSTKRDRRKVPSQEEIDTIEKDRNRSGSNQIRYSKVATMLNLNQTWRCPAREMLEYGSALLLLQLSDQIRTP